MLFYFGLKKEVIGITKFCIHPKEWHTNKTKVGGTKNINIDIVKKLNPDLIIANKEDNEKDQVEELAKHFPVWVTNVNNLQDAMQMITDVGELTHVINKAENLIAKIKRGFSQLQTTHHKLKTIYLIWKDPYMTVGGDTFINDMMDQCGLQNIFEHQNRYPQITLDALQNVDTELILLSSEPYPFKEKHIHELQQYIPAKKIILVDGEMFSWYGSRLLHAPAYFKDLIKSISH